MFVLFQRFNDFLSKKINGEKTEANPFTIPDGIKADGDVYLLVFQSNMVKAKIKRVLDRIPSAYRHIGFYGDIKYHESKLQELLNAKFGESHVLFTKNGAGQAKFISIEAFVAQMESVLEQLNDLLGAAELSISLLKQSTFDHYNDGWGHLSRELKLAMHAKGFLPSQVNDVEDLWIEKSYKFNSLHYDVFKGIGALVNLQVLKINSKIDCEYNFNKLSQLPMLKQLIIEEGPKIKWPNDTLNIEKGIMLEDVTVLNAQKPEAYQFIFHLENVKKISLMNFNKQNIYHILDFLIYRDLEEINIHFSSKIGEAKNEFLEEIIRPYCGEVRVNFYQPLEIGSKKVSGDKLYW
ncbi:hypothetical protein [Echinicola salinicaeni]|uniref:hypothetical protein n=1 Tax=Echinicola salinicaeni TaxID=2762757 RepID=UPI0016494E31|nr:hypothetical protein [Echinicola salinicaeni]